jgi:hypothetical protein
LLLFLYVTEEAGWICVWDMPWSLAAECNMITNKQTRLAAEAIFSSDKGRCVARLACATHPALGSEVRASMRLGTRQLKQQLARSSDRDDATIHKYSIVIAVRNMVSL